MKQEPDYSNTTLVSSGNLFGDFYQHEGVGCFNKVVPELAVLYSASIGLVILSRDSLATFSMRTSASSATTAVNIPPMLSSGPEHNGAQSKITGRLSNKLGLLQIMDKRDTGKVCFVPYECVILLFLSHPHRDGQFSIHFRAKDVSSKIAQDHVKVSSR